MHMLNSVIQMDNRLKDHFMTVAYLTSQLSDSEDPKTKVGACIVDSENRLVSTGYDTFPKGCEKEQRNMWPAKHKDESPNQKFNNDLLDGHLYVYHAELNAICNAPKADLTGCTMFVVLHPCNECAKLIIQSGIEKVFYFSNKKHGDLPFKASERIFLEAKRSGDCTQHIPENTNLTLNLDSFNEP